MNQTFQTLHLFGELIVYFSTYYGLEMFWCNPKQCDRLKKKKKSQMTREKGFINYNNQSSDAAVTLQIKSSDTNNVDQLKRVL